MATRIVAHDLRTGTFGPGFGNIYRGTGGFDDMEITFPLFVRAKDDGEIYRFDSIYEFQDKFEEIDIENQEFEAWDKEGIPVRFEVQRPVSVKLVVSQVPEFNRLREAISQFAQSLDLDVGDFQPESVEGVVAHIRTELEKRRLAKSGVRRLIARLRGKVVGPAHFLSHHETKLLYAAIFVR